MISTQGKEEGERDVGGGERGEGDKGGVSIL